MKKLWPKKLSYYTCWLILVSASLRRRFNAIVYRIASSFAAAYSFVCRFFLFIISNRRGGGRSVFCTTFSYVFSSFRSLLAFFFMSQRTQNVRTQNPKPREHVRTMQRLLVVVATLCFMARAFIPCTPFLSSSRRQMSLLSSSSTDAPAPAKVVTQEITAATLQQMVLKDQYGKNVKLSDRMGRGMSVVVFLRHLA